MVKFTHQRAVGLGLRGVLLVGLVWLAAPAVGQPMRQKSYPVSALVIEYPLPHERHPDVEELLALELEWRVTRGGLLAPHPATPSTRFPLGEIPPGTRFWTAGLQHLTRELLAEFERRRIGGVIITLPDLEEGSGEDLRRPGETRLRVRIWTGRVENIATVADGWRHSGSVAERTDLPQHDWVRQGSPVQPGGDRGLIDARAIEDYSRRLSRHPGRRVDARLRPGTLTGTSVLEYHVAEYKPWLAYAQMTNTGTRATGHMRQRFGFQHTQLTERDDILRLDYSTASFDQVHGVFGSYETPLGCRCLRLRAFGSWSQYDGSELGDRAFEGLGGSLFEDVEFSGDQWEAGARVDAELLQRGPLFVDVFVGARWRDVSVENENFLGDPVFAEGSERFLLAGGGIRLSYDDWVTRFELEAGLESNLSGAAGTETEQLIELGAVDPETDFNLLRWHGELSFYLEPLLYARRGYGDPGSAARSTLAHEVVVRTLGQWSLGDRLVPQFQQVVGGLHTVRGYRQSVVAGDGAAVGSLEYRIHLSRMLDPGGEPVEIPVIGPFAFRPRSVFARADWDLVLKFFGDLGVVWEESGRNVSYEEETLAGWGFGAELQLLRHVRAGADVAFRRSGLSDGSRPSGRARFHTYLTVTF